MALDARLLNNDYDAIAQKINNLSQDIQTIKRQSDLIGGIDDTAKFRKQVTMNKYILIRYNTYKLIPPCIHTTTNS